MAKQENQPILLADVARKAGVSMATVSLSLSGQGTISRKTRDFVCRVAQEIGYRPNLAASMLARQKQDRVLPGVPVAVIGMGFKDRYAFPADHFVPRFFEHAAQRGFVVEEAVPADYPSFSQMLRVLYHRGIRGIVLSHSVDTSSLTEEDVAPFSILYHGQPTLESRFHRVCSEVFKSTRFLWETMWKRGYRRIGAALYRHPQDIEDDFAREAAVINCQVRYDAPRLPIYSGGLYDGASMVRWFHEIKPDAILAFGGGQYYHFTDAGYRPPEDVAFAALHINPLDEKVAGLCEDFDELARLTVIHLDSMIRHHETGFPACRHELLVSPVFREGKTLPLQRPVEVKPAAKLKKSARP